jgi:hypothetical protein
MVKRAAWLSITPEPERELPRAVATLVHRSEPAPGEVAAEEARIERLVLHGSQRDWLRYLHGVLELIEDRARDPDPDVRWARSIATAVISNHHNLLLALPGRGAQISAGDRVRLARLDTDNHEVKGHT